MEGPVVAVEEKVAASLLFLQNEEATLDEACGLHAPTQGTHRLIVVAAQVSFVVRLCLRHCSTSCAAHSTGQPTSRANVAKEINESRPEHPEGACAHRRLREDCSSSTQLTRRKMENRSRGARECAGWRLGEWGCLLSQAVRWSRTGCTGADDRDNAAQLEARKAEDEDNEDEDDDEDDEG